MLEEYPLWIFQVFTGKLWIYQNLQSLNTQKKITSKFCSAMFARKHDMVNNYSINLLIYINCIFIQYIYKFIRLDFLGGFILLFMEQTSTYRGQRQRAKSKMRVFYIED